LVSLTDSPKCVATRNEQELDAPVQNYRNWTIRFGKPDPPVFSGPTVVSGATELRRGAPPLVK
jgi:hypothetical protein